MQKQMFLFLWSFLHYLQYNTKLAQWQVLLLLTNFSYSFTGKEHELFLCSIYEKEDYKSFNDFFIRNIKKSKRKLDDGIVAVCDSKLTIYKISDDLKLKVKNSVYTIEELIKEKNKYKYALVFRLDVRDYHHYIYIDDGIVISNKTIECKLAYGENKLFFL